MSTKLRVSEPFANKILNQALETLKPTDSTQPDNAPFYLKGAQLFGFAKNPNGKLNVTGNDWNFDVYALLDSSGATELTRKSDYICVLTCGWAAPIREDNANVAPSADPDRRRVFVSVIASRDQIGSIVRFENTPEENLFTNGGQGQMVEALGELFARASEVN